MANVVTIDNEELKAGLRAMRENVARVLLDAALAGAVPIVERAKRDAPGPNVAAEIGEVVPGKTVIIHIGPDAEHWYYRFIEHGTQPHEVTPDQRQALKLYQFEGDAGAEFSKFADVAGVTAKPFLRPALDSEADAAVREIGEVLTLAVLAAAQV